MLDGYKAGQKNDTYDFERSGACHKYSSLYKYGFMLACEEPTSEEVCESYIQRNLFHVQHLRLDENR